MSSQEYKRAITTTDASEADVSRAPVAVPNEILTRIFSFAVDNLPSKPSMITAAKIGLVCKDWRKILYSTPSLWSRLSLEFTDRDDGTKDVIRRETSTEALAICLALSHPVPLYFRFFVRDDTSDWALRSWLKMNAFDETYMAKAFYMLLAHSARWKQASFTCDSWIVELLDAFRYMRCPELESLTFLVRNNAQPDAWLAESLELEHVRMPSLKHLDINIHIPFLRLNWESLKSLTIGFEGPDDCRGTLSRVLQLEVLTITHIGCLPMEDTTEKLILPRVQQLNLTKCAAYNLFDGLVVPNLKELGLVAFPEDQKHSAHDEPGLYQCGQSESTYDAIEQVIGVLQNSEAKVDKFTVTWHAFSRSLLGPIMALVQSASVLSLSLEMDETSMKFLEHFVYSKPPLFPHLKELSLGFDLASALEPTALLASFGPIEDLVCARKAAGLRKFTIERRPGLLLEDENAEMKDLSPSIYASSSLARALCKMSEDPDFEVQWTSGPDIDIMHYAAAYTVPLS